MLKHGTLLHTIRSQSLYIECGNCGHSDTMAVESLLGFMRRDAAVRDVLARMRCVKCGSREIGEVRSVAGPAKPLDVDEGNHFHEYAANTQEMP